MTVAEIVLEEARRNLTRQEANLDSLRSRATAVLSVGALVFSLIGDRNFDNLDAAGWAAVGSFAASAIASVWVLWPAEFCFNLKLAKWMEELDPGHHDADATAWQAASVLATQHDRNKDAIDWRTTLYTFACAGIPAQMAFWVLSGLA